MGGNHLVKNLKALAGLAVFFGDDMALALSLGQLVRQTRSQLLPDGGHYERAPAYHCQVLGDLIDVEHLLRAAGRAVPFELADAITAMRGWLGAVLTPAGDVPLLNDGFPVDPGLLALLAASPAPGGPLRLLPETGLARVATGGWHVLADVGPPCPRDLPAHAHADTLGCVVHLDGQPLLIDTGTSTYAPGAARDRERSTAAHNTLEVDGQDSTEVWGAFRAGRRARVFDLAARADPAGDTVTVEAAHDGYRHLPGRPVHHRRWTVRAGELRVDDTVTGRGRHQVTVRWHLAPGTRLRPVPGGAVVTSAAGDLHVAVTAAGESAQTAVIAPPLTAGTAPRRGRLRPDRHRPAALLHPHPRAARPDQHRLAPGAIPTGANVKQIVQPVSGGPVTLLDVPRPVPEPTEVLVRTVSSVISAGTERAVTSLAQSSLLAKARARPDLVRQVIKKAKTEGIAATRQVVARLAKDVPLGYSAAGVVIEAGSAVTGIRPGQLVATGGAGKANHAEFQAVPGLLCAPVPDGVSAQDAAFTTIASIALHGLRIAEAGPGSKVVVVGLGLIGQLAARLAMAAGCDVAGIDPAAYPREVAAADRRARAGRARRPDHRAGARLVPRPGRRRGAGLRGRPVARRGDAGARAVP